MIEGQIRVGSKEDALTLIESLMMQFDIKREELDL